MSSRVGTAIPASRSTALSSAAVGLNRSTQTALSGSLDKSSMVTFLREVSEGTNTENMGTPGGTGLTFWDLAQLGRGLMTVLFNRPLHFVALRGRHRGTDSARPRALPKKQPESENVAA